MAGSIRALSPLAAAAGLLAACAGSAEQPVVGRFFSASRLLDRTALARVSTVLFDPRTDGTVASFSILAISPEQHRPLPAAGSARAPFADIVDRSLDGAGASVNRSNDAVELVTKDVTVRAPVRTAAGAEVVRTIIVTLERAIARGDREVTGRWIVTRFRDAPGAAPGP